MSKIFLSHKQQFVQQADALHAALLVGVPGATVFQSEDIDKGEEWRKAVNEALDDAKCFILLYGSPEHDWSWCFYEAGRFLRKGRKPRPVASLRPNIVEIPSPLAYIQGINEKQDDIRKWLKGSFFRNVRARKPEKGELDEAAKAIEKLVKEMLARENSFKPYIWIVPKVANDWKTRDDKREQETTDEREIDFSNSMVEVDEISARALGFTEPPNLELLPFLRLIACDTSGQPDKIEFWITKFFESLKFAVRSKTNFQEEAYFRHESGKILRPVVVSYVKNANSTVCRLRIVFVEAFGSPLTDSPGLAQRLSIGARLAIRTRLEIIDPFIGRVSQTQKDKLNSTRDEDKIGRKFGIGGRLVEALDTIVREASSHGVRINDDPPILFDGSAQHQYEEIRHRGEQSWSGLEEAARQGDLTGDYSETERLLGELKQINEDYLALVLPRIEELLVPAKKRHAR
jgi:TIR domain